jgi:hypothetical protein
MSSPLVISGIIIAGILLYFFWKRIVNKKPEPDTDTTRPAENLILRKPEKNDKLIIVEDIDQADLQKVLTGFCNMYNKENYQVLPRLTALNGKQFAISFPFDIDFEIYCYLINYLTYPMEMERIVDVTAWATTKSKDNWITEKITGKKAMLFIPEDDTEHDNVYLTTFDNTGYRIGFGLGDQKLLIDGPKKNYKIPPIEIANLETKKYTDFK